jgi:hypothetical protein
MRTSVRRSVCGAVLVAGAVALSACGDQPTTAAPVSEAAATSGAVPTTDELDDALLPAAAFGADATVVGLSLEQLGDLPELAGLPEGTTVEPALCGAALAMLPGAAGDRSAELPTLVGQGAFTADVRTVEVLADGPAVDGLELPVDQLLAGCSTVTVTGADGAVTTVDLAALDLPDLGETTVGLQVTVTSAGRTLPALVGVVTEGSRAVLLAQLGDGGAAPDPAAFGALLAEAADTAID